LGSKSSSRKSFRQRPLVIGFAVIISCFSSGFGAHVALTRSPGIDRVVMIHDCPAEVARRVD
jgi:hypothetical protein